MPLDSVEMRGRQLQIGGTELVQCLPANRLSKIELSLRRSSHGSAARSSMVSSRVLRRRQMIATLARALSRVRRPATDVEELKTIAIFCGAGLLFTLVAAMAFGLALGPEPF
ncbi:hypothetical protein IVB12_07675 [Bradyrhizobium sp. 179]|uniref:hypothetical protein n=1 Tax=Bradyrhizobium sp. 179 TaxID=2782648 RepID=UPI001FF7C484|nr:hypothetical protein [Bradyrhizobium sp. 179]MCK1541860.1 hypothetical protein [Bradyrhizobium sp. 179]